MGKEGEHITSSVGDLLGQRRVSRGDDLDHNFLEFKFLWVTTSVHPSFE